MSARYYCRTCMEYHAWTAGHDMELDAGICPKPDAVTIPGERYEALCDAERIAWAMVAADKLEDDHDGIRPHHLWHCEFSQTYHSIKEPGGYMRSCPPGWYLGQTCSPQGYVYLGSGVFPVLTDEARAIIDAAREREARERSEG